MQTGTLTEMRWVNCECCGGSGEIIRAAPAGAYQEPVEQNELCGACDGTGRDCVAVSPAERDDDQEQQ